MIKNQELLPLEVNKINRSYLKDENFLKLIDELNYQEQYAKITLLDWKENPIQEIQGFIISGNINIDGKSSLRRTGNISLVIDEATNDFTKIERLISINKKIQIEIGYKNTTNQYQEYPIIWFPYGVFILFDPTFSHNTSSATMSFQFKDKMCLLNGDVGGVFPSSVTLDQMDTIDEEGNEIIVRPTIYQIIQEVVNHYGGEQLSKIIISDLDTRIKQVMRWMGGDAIYGQYNNGSYTIYIDPPPGEYDVISTGMDIGYTYQDFTYTSDLIANAGDTVCSVLDKILQLLGNFEYFYDVDGNFIFREKRNYLNTTQAKNIIDTLNNNNNLYDIEMPRTKTVYEFNNSNLITSYSNTPHWTNIKNDFIIWGIRESVTGQQLPIRYHLAIDSKPIVYGQEYNVKYKIDENNEKIPVAVVKNKDQNTETIKVTDWRTLLYLQALSGETLAIDSNDYSMELIAEWPKLYDIFTGKFKEEVTKMPYAIDYYLDFIDKNAPISEFSVRNIGKRTKVISDNSINCLFEPDIPNVIIINKSDPKYSDKIAEANNKEETICQVSQDIYDNLHIGGHFNSAYNLVKDLLYQYTNYNESISLQCIPIHHLEPNTRISVYDEITNISGDYIIDSMSIPLDINGTMSITATRALTKI